MTTPFELCIPKTSARSKMARKSSGILVVFVIFIPYVESTLCEIGEALKDPNNPLVDRMCSTNGQAPCPTGFVCTEQPDTPTGICCISKETVCALPPTPGRTCGSAVPAQKFYFDPGQRVCQAFTYNGCFGNNNNFYSKEECERICSRSPNGGNKCNQLMQQGSPCWPGSQPVARYYYDPNTRACQWFQFMGCGGNENNFNTIQECQDQCAKGGPSGQTCPDGSPPSMSQTCDPSFPNCAPGFGCVLVQFYNRHFCCPSGQPNTPRCSDGTAANTRCNPQFSTCSFNAECQFVSTVRDYFCCPRRQTATPRCADNSQPVSPCDPQQPICQGGTTCQATTCPGCPVGPNSFACCPSGGPGGDKCPDGSIPTSTCDPQFRPCSFDSDCLRSPVSGQNICCKKAVPGGSCPANTSPAPGPVTCNPHNPFSCQNGFTCQQSPQNPQQWLCCSQPSITNLCPAGSTIDPRMTSVCTSSRDCSQGYICEQSGQNGQRYCCSNRNFNGLCPVGANPAPGITIDRSCTSMGGQCPTGYSCQWSPQNGQMYCCSSDQQPPESQLCPAGTNPAPGTTVVNTCFPGSNTCPMNHACQQSPSNAQRWYCCSQRGGSNGGSTWTFTFSQSCPAGMTPLLNPSTTQPVKCFYFGDRFCPSPATCEITGTFSTRSPGVCCRRQESPQIGNADCPQGYTDYRLNGQTVTCGFDTPQPNHCPPSVQCVRSLTRGVFVCCGAFTRNIKTGARALSYCETDTDCALIKNAVCIVKSCQCPDGQPPSPENGCQMAVINGTTTEMGDVGPHV